MNWDFVDSGKYDPMLSILLNPMRLTEKLHYQEAIRKVSGEFVLEHIGRFDKTFWEMFSAYNTVSEGVLKELHEKIDWEKALSFRKFSEEFLNYLIDNHLEKKTWFWSSVSYYQILSEKFMIEHSEKLNWRDLSYTQNMSREFILENLDKIVLTALMKNTKINKSDLNDPEFKVMVALLGYDTSYFDMPPSMLRMLRR